MSEKVESLKYKGNASCTPPFLLSTFYFILMLWLLGLHAENSLMALL